MPILLIPRTAPTPPPITLIIGPLQFFDETGYNPFPPGVFVQITTANEAPPITGIPLVAQGWIVEGGYVWYNGCPVTLQSGNYTATFFGVQAPPFPFNFSYVADNTYGIFNHSKFNQVIFSPPHS